MDKEKRNVFKAFTLILQLGINIMVPIALCVAIGVFIDRKFNTYWTVLLLFIGIMAGGRNAYKLAMSVAADGDKKKSDKSQDGKDDGNA